MQKNSNSIAAFRKLHETGCFVIPNPWDVGTARYLGALGFQALATTSAGFAFSQGLPDGEQAVSRDAMLRHIAEIVAAVDLPINADFQSGYADEPEGVAENVKLCVETGVAGLSIEDATGDRAKPLYDWTLAVERIKAARAAIDATESGVLLIGRAECYLADLGARRISVGSSLARAAWSGFARAAKLIAEQGDFSGFDGALPHAELNEFFRKNWKERAANKHEPRMGTNKHEYY